MGSTSTQVNGNAPNRLYVNGAAIYLVQANALPTTTLNNCTAPLGGFTAAGRVQW